MSCIYAQIPARVIHAAVRACASSKNDPHTGREELEELLVELEASIAARSSGTMLRGSSSQAEPSRLVPLTLTRSQQRRADIRTRAKNAASPSRRDGPSGRAYERGRKGVAAKCSQLIADGVISKREEHAKEASADATPSLSKMTPRPSSSSSSSWDDTLSNLLTAKETRGRGVLHRPPDHTNLGHKRTKLIGFVDAVRDVIEGDVPFDDDDDEWWWGIDDEEEDEEENGKKNENRLWEGGSDDDHIDEQNEWREGFDKWC